MSDCSGNEIICKKKREIELMTRDELYEKYGIPGMTLNDARLYYCIENKLDIKYFKELLELGVDLEYNDDDHNYPLWEAIKHKNDIEVIKLLKDAYYEEDVALKCHFYNPNIWCRACELEYHPENKENFYLEFEGTIKEYLHILYFNDRSYLKYFDIFNLSPITDITEISENDSNIYNFYNLYLKFFYIDCKHENKIINMSKYSDLLYDNLYDINFINDITLFIDELLYHKNIDKLHILLTKINTYDDIIVYDILKLVIKLEIDIELLKIIVYKIQICYLFFNEVIWINKNTISDLYIYKIRYASDLIRILYNITHNDIYQEYYNLLNIELIDNL